MNNKDSYGKPYQVIVGNPYCANMRCKLPVTHKSSGRGYRYYCERHYLSQGKKACEIAPGVYSPASEKKYGLDKLVTDYFPTLAQLEQLKTFKWEKRAVLQMMWSIRYGELEHFCEPCGRTRTFCLETWRESRSPEGINITFRCKGSNRHNLQPESGTIFLYEKDRVRYKVLYYIYKDPNITMRRLWKLVGTIRMEHILKAVRLIRAADMKRKESIFVVKAAEGKPARPQEAELRANPDLLLPLQEYLPSWEDIKRLLAYGKDVPKDIYAELLFKKRYGASKELPCLVCGRKYLLRFMTFKNAYQPAPHHLKNATDKNSQEYCPGSYLPYSVGANTIFRYSGIPLIVWFYALDLLHDNPDMEQHDFLTTVILWWNEERPTKNEYNLQMRNFGILYQKVQKALIGANTTT